MNNVKKACENWGKEKDVTMTADQYIAELKAEIKAKDEEIESLSKALDNIQRWVEAYPLDIFPKPDLKKARKILKAAGMTLDSISADVMRDIKDIVEEALKGEATDGEDGV